MSGNGCTARSMAGKVWLCGGRSGPAWIWATVLRIVLCGMWHCPQVVPVVLEKTDSCHSLKVRSMAAPWGEEMSWQAPQALADSERVGSSKGEEAAVWKSAALEGSEVGARITPSAASWRGLLCVPVTWSTEWQK